MPQPPAGIAVQLAPGTPLRPDADVALLRSLNSAGLDGASLVLPETAALVVRLLQPSGWDALNLAALVAAARARPGSVVALHPGTNAPAAVLAVDGPAELLAQAPDWRLDWPGPALPTTALLDRDGTINVDRHYLADPEGVTLLPGSAEGLRHLMALGMRLVVVSNQSGVAAGRITLENLAAVNARLRSLLGAEGVTLAGIFCCLHAPGFGCDCRKPADGLARQAAQQLGIDLGRVLVAGDKDADVGLGRGLGAPTFLVRTGHGMKTLSSGGIPADYLVEDLRELARICAHPAGLGRPQRTSGDGAPLDG